MPQETDPEVEREVEKIIVALRGLPGGTSVTDDDRKHVLEQLAAKNWNDLGVLEGLDGTLLLPWKIWRRDKSGAFAAKDVLLRVPDGPILRRARIEARKMAVDDGLDLDRDKDLVDDLETLSILFWSVREPTEPYEPIAMDAKDFEKIFNREVLKQTNFALTHAQRIFSPKVAGMNVDELCALTAAIVARQSILPLVAFDDATQASFVITMARLHQAFLMVSSSPGQPARSTAG